MESTNKTGTKDSLLLLIAVSLFCLLALEITVRFMGDYDADDRFYFKERLVIPAKVPYNSLINGIERFKSSQNPYLIPNGQLGWVTNNNTEYAGMYRSNSIGLRTDKEFNITKNPGILRIALFGDSYIHSLDVPFEESLEHYLRERFDENKVEIMNFGNGGYGNDQAYLRWLVQGRGYNPDIVIIGFQPENCKRNLNIIRQFYKGEGDMPFSKPRFIYKDKKLTLVNYPTISYESLPEELKDFERSYLREYEYYYRPKEDITDKMVHMSRALSTALVVMNYIGYYGYDGLFESRKFDKEFFRDGSDETELCYRVLNKFALEASATSEVYFVHIPLQYSLQDKLNGREFYYAPLLSMLKENFRVIDPTEYFLKEAKATSLKGLFVGHYSGKGNKILADTIYESLNNEDFTSQQIPLHKTYISTQEN